MLLDLSRLMGLLKEEGWHCQCTCQGQGIRYVCSLHMHVLQSEDHESQILAQKRYIYTSEARPSFCRWRGWQASSRLLTTLSTAILLADVVGCIETSLVTAYIYVFVKGFIWGQIDLCMWSECTFKLFNLLYFMCHAKLCGTIIFTHILHALV